VCVLILVNRKLTGTLVGRLKSLVALLIAQHYASVAEDFVSEEITEIEVAVLITGYFYNC
jgi:hypothetical protein